MESAFPKDLRSASFLGSFNSLFPGAGGGMPTTKHPRNARPLPGSLYLPPEGLRGAGSSLTVRGALHRRPIRPPQSGLRVGVIITIARPGGSGSSPRRGRIRTSPPFPRVP